MFNLFKVSKTARMIIDRIESSPSSWQFDGFDFIYRDAPVQIWVANKEYGLTINKFAPSKKDREAIYAAYKKWAELAITLALGGTHVS